MNANTSKQQNSPTEHLHEALLLWSRATPKKQAKALEILRKEPAAKRYPLPASISDLVETDIRGDAFELVAITKAISEWSANQRVFPIEGAVLDMDVGDMVTLSSMAVQRAQRIVELTNDFESKVTSIGVQA